jgi:endonuclease III
MPRLPAGTPTPKPPRRLPLAARSATETYARLRLLHPDAHCELDHATPFQLVVATVLSAQTTDKLVNQITPELFAAYGTAEALAVAEVAEVERILSRMGMFRQKAKNIVGLAKMIEELHHGEVPRTLEALTALPGVGRKTANVVMGTAFDNAEGIVVDTHVQRLSQRLGWTKETEAVAIEEDLLQLFPKPDYAMLSHTLIFHGRRVCAAQRPACGACGIHELCPSAGQAEKVGRKPPRTRERPAKATSKKAGAKQPKANEAGAKRSASNGARSTPASAQRSGTAKRTTATGAVPTRGKPVGGKKVKQPDQSSQTSPAVGRERPGKAPAKPAEKAKGRALSR